MSERFWRIIGWLLIVLAVGIFCLMVKVSWMTTEYSGFCGLGMLFFISGFAGAMLVTLNQPNDRAID